MKPMRWREVIIGSLAVTMLVKAGLHTSRRWFGGLAAWMLFAAVSITGGLWSWSCHATALVDAKANDFRAYTTNWPNSGVMTFIHHLPRTNAPVSYRYVWAEDQWMIVVESGEPPPGERLDARRSPDALGVDSKGPWRIRSTSEAGDLSLTRFSMASAEEQERRMWGLRERILFIRTFGLVGVEPEDLLWHGPKAEFQSRQIPGFAVISTNSIGQIVMMDAYYGAGTSDERRSRLTYAYGDHSSLPGFPIELQLTLLAPVQQVGARYVISSFEPRGVWPHELDPEFLLGTLAAPRYHVVAQTTFRETGSGLRELGSVPPRYEQRRVLIIIVLLCLLLAPWLWMMISRYCRR